MRGRQQSPRRPVESPQSLRQPFDQHQRIQSLSAPNVKHWSAVDMALYISRTALLMTPERNVRCNEELAADAQIRSLQHQLIIRDEFPVSRVDGGHMKVTWLI